MINENRPDDYFGCYVWLPQIRRGQDNVDFKYKVVGMLRSNCWREPPFGHYETRQPILHDDSQPVLNVICCGVSEEKVERVALKDVIKMYENDDITPINFKELLEEA